MCVSLFVSLPPIAATTDRQAERRSPEDTILKASGEAHDIEQVTLHFSPRWLSVYVCFVRNAFVQVKVRSTVDECGTEAGCS